LWSLFGIANAFVGRLVTMHVLVRSAFAVGEGGNFPASIKTVAEWFPKRQRAPATGIFNSGANLGAVATILLVPLMAEKWGWQSTFLGTGAIGLIWVGLWL